QLMSMPNDKTPVLGVTMGDPAGIGPEISIKSLMKPEMYQVCRPVLIGDLSVLKRTAERLGLDVKFKILRSPRSAGRKNAAIELIDLGNVDLQRLEIGKVSAVAGRASIDYIEKAVGYALMGELDAVVTGPINKKAISLAGSSFIGHTEMIAALCGVKEPLTMFWVRGARIFFLTRHLPLKDALKAVKEQRIIEMTVKIADALMKIGLDEPRIAVAALNPHASDGGLIGTEDEQEIEPAVEELRKRGINVRGPVPADSIFHQAVEGRYDAVLSLYHDQGHIAAKTLDFYGTVSVTLGLPFIRTSVDHGTAHDIAGKGIANSRSLEEAMRLAAAVVGKTRERKESRRQSYST
ncbi:MAG: 4-hydroxythreonine-4-phosphate dehydrogenase PdxA, partial [Nitrososphaeria archaeon]